MKELESKNIISGATDTENMAMSEEIIKELEKMENVKSEDVVFDVSNKIDKILTETITKNDTKTDKTLEYLKSKYDTNTSLYKYYGIHNTRCVIAETIKEIKDSKDMFIKNIKSYLGVSLVRGFYNMYGINIPMGVDDTDNEIELYNYEKCLLDWLNDTIEHFEDLYVLTSFDLEDFRPCIQNCYFELKILCYKLIYAIGEGLELESNLNSYDYFYDDPETEEKYRKLWKIADKKELKELCDKYKYIYDKVCSIGNYIFAYTNQYE
jgi:hypothetical protein